MHSILWTDSPPPNLLTADSAQQYTGAILFGDACGHIRVFIAGDHRYYQPWPEPMCPDSENRGLPSLGDICREFITEDHRYYLNVVK